ncbi:MAG: hypothetical protein K8R17_06310 [Methanosarcinales archaeon]|nr:hypothetical protein [Methanosarcinales archaeon]
MTTDMTSLKINDRIISIVSVNATLIGIFTALYLAYTVNTYSKIEELEFDALKEAEKINRIHCLGSPYIPGININDFNKKYHNMFVYVNFLLSENPPKDLKRYPIPKDTAERARKALSIMTSIMRTYPFPDYSSRADRKAGYPAPIYFSDFDELRDWVTSMKELLDAYNVFRFSSLANTISFKMFDDLAGKEKELIAASKNNNLLRVTVFEPKVILNNISQNIDIAYNVWAMTSYRLNVADNYRKKMSPKIEVLFFLSFVVIVFISGVILPLLWVSVRKIYFLYLPILFYLIILFYIFKIALRVVW